jgi:hypothetical protein
MRDAARAGVLLESNEPMHNAVLVASTITLVTNGVYVVRGERAPEQLRIVGGTLGTAQLVSGVILLFEDDASTAYKTLHLGFGFANIVAAILAGRETTRTVRVEYLGLAAALAPATSGAVVGVAGAF